MEQRGIDMDDMMDEHGHVHLGAQDRVCILFMYMCYLLSQL